MLHEKTSVSLRSLRESSVELMERAEGREGASVTSYDDLPSLLISTEYEWSVPDGLQEDIKATPID